MSDVALSEGRRMTVEETITTRTMPLTATQLTGHTATMAVEGLTGRSPYVLALVVLSILWVGSAVYFLNVLIQGQQAHLKTLVETLKEQQTEIVALHKAEFDQLLAMIPRDAGAPAPPAVPVPVVPLPQGRR